MSVYCCICFKFFILFQTLCPDSKMDRCLEVHMEDDCVLPTTVYVFQLLQSGIIFIALVAGVVSLTHILYFRFRTCANSGSLAVLVLVGLIHLISGIYQLQFSEYSTENGFPGCKTGGCLDMYVISTICNTLMLLVIVCKVITNNASTKVQALLSLACFSLTTFLGLGMILRSPDNNQTKENDSIATLGKENQTHLEVFLSFCQKSVMEESYRLWFEYSLVYFPATFVVFVAWYRTKHQTKGKLQSKSKTLCQAITGRVCQTNCLHCNDACYL